MIIHRYESVSIGIRTARVTVIVKQKKSNAFILNNILRKKQKQKDLFLKNYHTIQNFTFYDYLSYLNEIVVILIIYKLIVDMVKQQPKTKNTKNYQPRQPHLIQKLTQKYEEPQQKEQPIQCKYGLYCAHLRVTGHCSLPHKRNHYLFLNLFPPANAIDDQNDQENQKLTKKEKKQKKIIQKTISQNIDVQALAHKEQQLKKKQHYQKQQEFFSKMDQKEKKLIELINSQSAQDFFNRLNEIKNIYSTYQFKKRSLIQIKKKNDKLYTEIIDKQYRIANRLIKQSSKNKKGNLLEMYLDINHNTIQSIRQYFEGYFDQDTGIPQEEIPDIQNQKIFISKILHSLFFRQVSEYQFQYYLIKPKSSLSQIKSNIQIYNLMVPFLHSQAMPFNKYLHLDCSFNFGLGGISQTLSNDHAITFHTKCKPHPEYPFGQLQANLKSFTHWASKLSNKYKQKNKEVNLILVLSNISHILPNSKAQQFQQQKLKQRRQTLKIMIKIFEPIIYFLADQITSQLIGNLSQLIDLQSTNPTRYQKKLQQIQQK